MKAEEFYHYTYFQTPSPWAEKCLLVSDGMGYTAAPDFRIDRRTFYNHLAFYVHQGVFYVEQYGKKFALQKGTLGILNLNDPHLYYTDPIDTTHLLWFHFRGAGTSQILETLKQNHVLPLMYKNPVFLQDFLEVFRLTRSGSTEMEISGHIYGLLMKLLQESPHSSAKTMQIPEELQHAAQYMEEYTQSVLTLEQVSAHVGMGMHHFSHMFKKWYGISPMQYYTGKKMEHACRLLKDNGLSIDVISEQLGYWDTGYFRKAFKNHFGITPASYRKLCN